jgi:hypothetical protein
VRNFQRAKARLMAQMGIKGEFHYVWNIIGGLKEEIRKPITLFKPKTLSEAINMAFEIEETVTLSEKKGGFLNNFPRNVIKQPPYLPYKNTKSFESVP